MKVTCLYNDPFNLPTGIPNDFDFGLELSKDYLVMGLVSYTESNYLYYLIDEGSRPNWFPYQLFEISDNSLPSNWFIQINGKSVDSDIYCVWGFEELCKEPQYYDMLVDRDKGALEIYFKRKVEFEQELI